jgi:drug/metabolite transporter (DMT)-like permease
MRSLWLTSGYGTSNWCGHALRRDAAAIWMGVRETGAWFSFRTLYWRFHTLRGILSAATAWFFFEALRTMPLADAVTIGFAAPLFVTALSGPLLGEKVGRQRWIVVLVGFVGVIVAFQLIRQWET